MALEIASFAMGLLHGWIWPVLIKHCYRLEPGCPVLKTGRSASLEPWPARCSVACIPIGLAEVFIQEWKDDGQIHLCDQWSYTRRESGPVLSCFQ